MCEVNLILNEINELENPKPQIIVSGFIEPPVLCTGLVQSTVHNLLGNFLNKY